MPFFSMIYGPVIIVLTNLCKISSVFPSYGAQNKLLLEKKHVANMSDLIGIESNAAPKIIVYLS